jgi:hypothetical protein
MTDAASTPAVRPVTTTTRAIFLVAAGLAAIAGIQLYILTDFTDHFFAWTIAQPLSAAFLGTGYWTGTVLLVFAAREKDWANIRVALAAVAVFVPLMLLTTLLHLDRFHFNSTDLNAWVAAWAWLIVYAAVPFLIVWAVVSQLRAPGGDPAPGPPMTTGFHWLIAINAVISGVLTVSLFFFPDRMTTIWPWTLTPLTAQAISAGFASVAAASLWFLKENSLDRARGGAVSYLLIGTLQLLAIARYADTIFWDRPSSWLYLAFMAAIFAGGVYATLRAWLPRPRGRAPAEEAVTG